MQIFGLFLADAGSILRQCTTVFPFINVGFHEFLGWKLYRIEAAFYNPLESFRSSCNNKGWRVSQEMINVLLNQAWGSPFIQCINISHFRFQGNHNRPRVPLNEGLNVGPQTFFALAYCSWNEVNGEVKFTESLIIHHWNFHLLADSHHSEMSVMEGFMNRV